jgi:FdrA protein
LAPVIGEVIGKSGKEIVVIVIGTEDDPQGLQAQIEQFTGAGAVVYRTVTEAVAHISRRFINDDSDNHPQVTFERFSQTPLAAINVGLESFHDSLIAQGARAVQVDWRPPAGGNERLASLLAKMKKQETP